MRFRPSLIVSLCTALGVAAVAACTTDYQQGKGDPNYGGPNALAGAQPPAATIDIQSDAGAVTPTSKAACVAAGGTLADAGACTVTFATDILGAFGTAGCSDPNCHGGATPRNQPGIETSDGPGTWQKFQGFTLSTGKAYIDPCSTDPASSQMGCNFIAAGGAGACGIHMPSTGQLPADAITKVNTWLKCGSPNN